MKKLIAITLSLVLMLTCCSALADTLTMVTNASFPPYEYYDGETIVGIDAEIAAAICSYLGYDLEIRDQDFSTCIPDVQAGKADFSMGGITVTEERAQIIDFSDYYSTGIQVVIVPEDSPITSADDLLAEGTSYKVGVQDATTGSLYITDDYDAAGKDSASLVLPYKTGNDAVMALVAGKVDCVVIDNEPAKAYVEANPGLKILDSAYVVEEYAVVISKDTPELLASFNEALAALKADGTIDAILAKYISAD